MEKIILKYDKPAYNLGENISFTININDTKKEEKELSNVSINIDRIDIKRNLFVLGFGFKPESENNKLSHSRVLPNNWEDGMYFVSSITMSYGDMENGHGFQVQYLPNRNYEIKYFHVSKSNISNITEIQIHRMVQEILKSRHEFQFKALETKLFKLEGGDQEYRVFIFGLGCLLRYSQVLEGHTIYPLNNGLSYSNMNDSVNEFLNRFIKLKIPFDNEIDLAFRRSTPLFVIDFKRVKAKDDEDALQFARNMSETIFSILGNIKGRRPSLFSSVAIEVKTSKVNYAYEFPGYKGNLVGDLVPFNTSRRIEFLMPVLEKEPWLKFLFDSHAYALNEPNINLKYFRFWAILELVSKKEVPNNSLVLNDIHGVKMLSSDGKVRKTYGALNKVYYYLRGLQLMNGNVGSNPAYYFEFNSNDGPPENYSVITLWEFLGSIYAIRNATAHTGSFSNENAKSGDWKNQLAFKYYKVNKNKLLIGQLETVMDQVINVQINKYK